MTIIAPAPSPPSDSQGRDPQDGLSSSRWLPRHRLKPPASLDPDEKSPAGHRSAPESSPRTTCATPPPRQNFVGWGNVHEYISVSLGEECILSCRGMWNHP